jgi:hypothetical protein
MSMEILCQFVDYETLRNDMQHFGKEVDILDVKRHLIRKLAATELREK